MTIALLTIGTELTRGELKDENGAWLACELSELGHEVTEIVTVDDDDQRIVSQLRRLAEVHQAVLCTGGLGPTTDDRTTACAAQAFGQPLVRDEKSLHSIREIFSKYGREMTASNEKQADFPRGSTVLENSRGTAPGFSLVFKACRFFFMPGVPGEMRSIFRKGVLPLLPKACAPVATARLRCFKMPEAEINDRLTGIEEKHGVTIGYRASHSEIEVKVMAQGQMGEQKEQVQARAERIADLVSVLLGSAVYGRGSTSLPIEIGKELQKRGLTLGLAESCTGGLVSQLVTEVPGSSAYYRGGVCSYANEVKEALLQVPSALLEEKGAVSEEVARAMSEGARRSLLCDVALSLTGIAGPSGGSEDKPIGLVYWAVSNKKETRSFSKVFRGTRKEVQKRAALAALHSVRDLVCETEV